MGLFSTLFGIGKKLARPLANLGKRMWGGLSGIGRKINNLFRGNPTPFKGTQYKGTKYTQKVADMFDAQRQARVPPSVSGMGVGGYTAKGGGFQYLPPRQPVDLLSKTPYKDTIVGLDF
tara:strand:- start:486 stop:842 length:357 start_codon:yes stop_codon:yes gene_type:complete